MSANPFQADAAERARIEALDAERGDAVRVEIARCMAPSPERLADNIGGVLAAADVARIVSDFGLRDIDDVMRLGLASARAIASPPISDFFVGAVGLERETGNLVFGGNVEFPATHFGYAIHGEGFVATRAFNRGTSIARIALDEAHPCGHCRQYLSEFALGPDLELIDPLGHRLTLGELYPWPFDTAYLGRPGAVAGADNWPDLKPGTTETPEDVVALLVSAGTRAHAPYSRCPGAVVLDLTDGQSISGASIESVAFNPSIWPLQSAIIDLRAHGYAYDDIAHVTLGTVMGGAVDHVASTRELLAAIAPDATLDVVSWTVQ